MMMPKEKAHGSNVCKESKYLSYTHYTINWTGIKAKLDIYSIYRQYFGPLIQKGNKFWGRCPYHADNNPSFAIYPNQRFYCFSCGAAGDAIDLIKKAKNMPIKEVVREYSDAGNIDKPSSLEQEMQKHKQKESDRQYGLLAKQLDLIRKAIDICVKHDINYEEYLPGLLQDQNDIEQKMDELRLGEAK